METPISRHEFEIWLLSLDSNLNFEINPCNLVIDEMKSMNVYMHV